MAEIRPFRGVLYEEAKLGGDLSDVVAPPYDVIPDGMREELYNKNKYNIIRLILGKDAPGDNADDNKYIRARKTVEEWLESGVFARDNKESFYVYRQEFTAAGKKRSRIGFLGLMKIDDPGDNIVVPHERTHSKPKEDRLNLIKEVEGNLSPIFTLYDDPKGVIKGVLDNVSSGEPHVDIDLDGVRHRLWRLSDAHNIETIVRCMAGKRVFIADGHHRYEVSRTYRDMRRKDPDYDGSADHVLMYFADMSDPENLTVLATHRVIKEMPLSIEEAEIKLSEFFSVTKCASLGELMSMVENRPGHVFGLFAGSEKYLFLKPKDEGVLLGLIEDDRTDDWKDLDVSVLHSAVLKSILSVSHAEGNITYVRDAEEGEALVRGGSHTAAFFLKPTRIDQLRAVAEHGEVMPQKSTYFYPKLLSGLVINRFNAGSAVHRQRSTAPRGK